MIVFVVTLNVATIKSRSNFEADFALSYRLSYLLISCIDIKILGSLSVRWVVGVAGPTLYSVVCTFVSQEAF